MAATLLDGKFVYETRVTPSNDKPSSRVVITLDLNHPELRLLIDRARRSKGQRAVEAGGALVVRVS